MTGEELRQRLCGVSRSFTLALGEIKERLGHPRGTRILPRWCRRTGRDIVVLTWATDDGEAQVCGPVGFLNGEETLFDGWVVVVRRSGADQEVRIHGQPRSIELQPSLFEDWTLIPVEPADQGAAGTAARRAPAVVDGRREPTLFDLVDHG